MLEYQESHGINGHALATKLKQPTNTVVRNIKLINETFSCINLGKTIDEKSIYYFFDTSKFFKSIFKQYYPKIEYATQPTDEDLKIYSNKLKFISELYIERKQELGKHFTLIGLFFLLALNVKTTNDKLFLTLFINIAQKEDKADSYFSLFLLTQNIINKKLFS